MDNPITPAAIVVAKFGGVRALARALGLNPSTVCKWGLPKERGGCDGRIPHKHHRALLDLASDRKKRLTLKELCFGR